MKLIVHTGLRIAIMNRKLSKASFLPEYIPQSITMRFVIVKPHHEEDIFVITRGRGGAEAEV